MRFSCFTLHRLCIGGLLFLSLSHSQAQSTSALSEVFVTATRQETRTSEVLSDVSYIGPKEIQNAGQSTLAELLGRQPGIEFKQSGGPGSDTSISIRGSNAGHALLLIDGMRVRSATLDMPTWQYIPLEQIDHIEIVRGAASSLYGSDAIGGVIQIFTKKGEGPAKAYAQVGYGTFNTKSIASGVSGGQNGWSYNFQVGDKTSNSFSATVPTQGTYSPYNPDKDGYRSTNSSGQLSYQIDRGSEVGMNYLYSQGWNRYDASPANADYKLYQTISSVSAYSKNRLNDAWVSKIQVGQSLDDNKSFSNASLATSYRTAQKQLLWQNDVELGSGLAMLGLERLDQHVGSVDTDYVVKTRVVDSVFAGWVKTSGIHNYQINVRNDRNSQYGSKSTGMFGYGYRINSSWRANASVATGFKAPGFNDLYYPDDGSQIGNPLLKAESSLNREISIHHEVGASHASLVHYQNDVKNLIQWNFNEATQYYSPINVANAKLSGWTAAFSNRLGSYRYKASLDLQNPLDGDTQKVLVYRAKEIFKFSMDKDFAALNLGAELVLSGKRYTDADNTKSLGGYSLINFYSGYKVSNDVSAYLRVNNLLNKTYTLVEGYATPRANLFAGLRFNLN
jgi:vitamin B12 transporter